MATGEGTGTPTSTGGTSLSDLQSICLYHGWNDTSTNGISALTRFINRTVNLLTIILPWPEYHKRDGTVTLATSDNDYEISVDDISKIGDLYHEDRTVPLDVITLEEWMQLTKTNSQSGFPTMYALRKYTSTGLEKVEVLLYPTPSSAENGDTLYFTYWKIPTQLSDSSDVTDWPTYRLWLLEEALEARIASMNRDRSGVALESPDFMLLARKAFADARPSYMPIRVREHPTTNGKTLHQTCIKIA